MHHRFFIFFTLKYNFFSDSVCTIPSAAVSETGGQSSTSCHLCKPINTLPETCNPSAVRRRPLMCQLTSTVFYMDKDYLYTGGTSTLMRKALTGS